MPQKISIKTNGQTFDTSQFNLISWTTVSNEWTVNPATGSPWTWNEIDSLQIGVTLLGSRLSTTQCTQVYVEIDYTEGGSSVIAKPFAVNTGAPISNTTQVGNLAIGTTVQNYGGGYGGVHWHNGPDETNRYIIAKDGGDHPTFWGSATKTDVDFIALVNSIRKIGPYYTLVSECTAWLSANGYYTTYA